MRWTVSWSQLSVKYKTQTTKCFKERPNDFLESGTSWPEFKVMTNHSTLTSFPRVLHSTWKNFLSCVLFEHPECRFSGLCRGTILPAIGTDTHSWKFWIFQLRKLPPNAVSAPESFWEAAYSVTSWCCCPPLCQILTVSQNHMVPLVFILDAEITPRTFVVHQVFSQWHESHVEFDVRWTKHDHHGSALFRETALMLHHNGLRKYPLQDWAKFLIRDHLQTSSIRLVVV